MVRFIAGNKSFDVPEEFQSLTSYIKDLQEFEGAKEEIVLNTISEKELTRIFEALKLAGYKFNEVPKVSSNDSRAYIGEALTGLFSGLSCKNYSYSRRRTEQSL